MEGDHNVNNVVHINGGAVQRGKVGRGGGRARGHGGGRAGGRVGGGGGQGGVQHNGHVDEQHNVDNDEQDSGDQDNDEELVDVILQRGHGYSARRFRDLSSPPQVIHIANNE